MIDTIVFDLGGVLVDWNPDYVFDEVFRDAPEKKQHFYQHICTADWNEQQDAGRSLAEATQELTEKFPEWESEIAAYYGRWEEMLGGPITEVVQLLADLRKQGKYRLVALTNWSSETFPIALARYEFLGWFEGILVSGVEGTRKPFEDFFHLLFKRYEIDPQRALFIDDNLRNVEAGRSHGMRSIRYQSPAQLMNELKDLGVEVTASETVANQDNRQAQ